MFEQSFEKSVVFDVNALLCSIIFPGLNQSQQCKHEENVRNLSKINNKDVNCCH